jgi:hypothetical protein
VCFKCISLIHLQKTHQVIIFNTGNFFPSEINHIFIFLNLLTFSNANPYIINFLILKRKMMAGGLGLYYFFSLMSYFSASSTVTSAASHLSLPSNTHLPWVGSFFWNLLLPWLYLGVKRMKKRGKENERTR